MQGQTKNKILNGQLQRTLRKNMTDAERRLWQALRNGQMGCKFRRQHLYESYFLDFVCLEQKLVIEVNGGQHAETVGYDTNRTTVLQRAGFRVLRFWNNEVLTELEAVKEQIWNTLQTSKLQTHPHPSPPLEGEGA
jgi:very-short-patch-repair endonuclease